MGEILLMVFTAFGTIGVIGLICYMVVRGMSNVIAERLAKKYTLQLNKELEQYKSSLESKIYISKMKFDVEFQIYRELATAFGNMLKNMNAVVPTGIFSIPADPDERKRQEDDQYNQAILSAHLVENLLMSVSPFISNELYKAYHEIFTLCRVQLYSVEAGVGISKEEKKNLLSDMHSRKKEMLKKIDDVNSKVREHLEELAKLEVV